MAPKKRQTKAGRPPKDKAVTPAQIMEIGRLVLQGWSLQAIGDKYGKSASAICDIVQRHHRPVWQSQAVADVQKELAKIEAIEAEAWERYRKSNDSSDLADARWAVEHRSKIHGFIVRKYQVDDLRELGGGGLTPEQHREQVAAKLLALYRDKIGRATTAETAITPAANNGNRKSNGHAKNNGSNGHSDGNGNGKVI